MDTFWKPYCEQLCNDKGFVRMIANLYNNRNCLQNDELLITARSLLRLSWSLQYSTIPDFINAMAIENDQQEFR